MVSKVIFFLLCCLCVSFTTAVSDSILQLVCRDACNRCTGAQGGAWCSICNCSTGQRATGPCATKRCSPGETCRVLRGGWFRREYAQCVRQSTTTTTTIATTLADGDCRESSDCLRNEACVISSGASVGTCQLVGGRTLSKNCVEERRLETCRARFPKYFYNVTAGECQGFFYGGCNPGLNHFDSLADCKQECVEGRSPSASSDARHPDCLKTKDHGLCRALINAFYYDSDSNTCEPFHYGGCGGNENRFTTINECETKCVLSS